jgi:hypothetical protein
MHPDIEIDCDQWRRDQAVAFPRRPVAGWPMPFLYRTRAFESTKLWISAADRAAVSGVEVPANLDPRQTLLEVPGVADRSPAGNHLRATFGTTPKLWPENFNHHDTLRFYFSVLSMDRPRGLDNVGDLEIMFPILEIRDSDGGVVVARDGAQGRGGWGVRVTPKHEIEWYQSTGQGGEQTVKSHALELQAAQLVHIRRIAATGEVYVLVDNAGSQRNTDFDGTLKPAASGKLSPGRLTASGALSVGGLKSDNRPLNTLEALVPDLFIDTALLSREQLAERKHYLRAAYGVWEGTQLDEPGSPTREAQ